MPLDTLRQEDAPPQAVSRELLELAVKIASLHNADVRTALLRGHPETDLGWLARTATVEEAIAANNLLLYLAYKAPERLYPYLTNGGRH